MRALVLIAMAAVAWGAGAGEPIVGKARVIDGQTLDVGSQRIRLHGIDAPDGKQTCTADGGEWDCGREATFALANLLGNHWIECDERGRDRYGRIVAVCRVGPYDISARMVQEGWALADRRYSSDYVDEENVAKAARIGIWRGEFTPPSEWRRIYEAESNRSTFQDRDCSDFRTWREAQAFFEQARPGDPHRLDRDKDGIACEGLKR